MDKPGGSTSTKPPISRLFQSTMNSDKSILAKPAETSATTPAVKPKTAEATSPTKSTRLFRGIDWWTLALVTTVVMIGYSLTLAPDLTLEDSGELAVASMYAGIPHPPGYPVWTVYTWLWAKLIPFSNIAWRVALGGAFAGAVACGLLGLIVSRGSSMMMEGIESLKNIDRRWENAICVVSGFVAGTLLGFNGFMWSQSVIVEVYSFSVLSLTGTLAFLLRWMYAPQQRRYLYWSFFIFGICFTNHQTLICAAMGMMVAVAAADHRLGRSMCMWASVAFLIGLLARSMKMMFTDTNPMVFTIFCIIGLASIATYVWLSVLTTKAYGKEDLVALACGGFWILGASFYLYMALAGMSTPPMQWGYPRTVDGFIHALTRGQYEKTNPTDFLSINGLSTYFEQLGMVGAGVLSEFNWVYTLLAVVPFLFFLRMQKRERAWMIGLVAIYLCLSALLVVLLNPSLDRQSRSITRVFFTASHVMVVIWIGYGLTLIAASLVTRYRNFRPFGLGGGALAGALALILLVLATEQLSTGIKESFFGTIGRAFQPGQYGLPVFAALLLLGLCVAFIVALLLGREKPHLGVVLGLFAAMPLYTVMSNWSDNEQRGHLFGYWFGHDMFTPPFVNQEGKLSYDPKEREAAMKDPARAKLTYPEMTRDAVLYGGTDPGRFCPTYMIFCESFIPPKCKPLDPNFDRRDVYIITQNALADGTYLMYIRSHYNKSAQIPYDKPFFQEASQRLFIRKPDDRDWHVHPISKLANNLLDKPFIALGNRIEAKRRAAGVYPKEEMYIATPEDSAKCFQEYMEDAQRRMQTGQLRPGEDVRVQEGRVQVSGQVAVMAINGFISKVMFDKNPTNEFFVEESFPLEWMYPHLTPFGVIMKVNREKLPSLPEDEMKRDHEFWSAYSERLIGNWITYDTSVKEIVDFAEKVYQRRDFNGFKGDRKFVRDDQAQKAFSKLRSSIAGVYAWRLGLSGGAPTPPEFLAKPGPERDRVLREADFAFKQAFAFCPYSPEAVFRYMFVLVNNGRLDDAILVVQTALKLDPNNPGLDEQLKRLLAIKNNGGQMAELQALQAKAQKLQTDWQNNPSNFQAALDLAQSYLNLGQQTTAVEVLDRVLKSPYVTRDAIIAVAQYHISTRNSAKIEEALQRLVEVEPKSPEAWYDLSAMKGSMGKATECVDTLRKSLELSDARLASQPGARNLRDEARKEGSTNEDRFRLVRSLPEFQALMAKP
jgi:tetratricopeptide (TPR) repeat protein